MYLHVCLCVCIENKIIPLGLAVLYKMVIEYLTKTLELHMRKLQGVYETGPSKSIINIHYGFALSFLSKFEEKSVFLMIPNI